jgi:asparagine synthase (glutamine-hydrolysing)
MDSWGELASVVPNHSSFHQMLWLQSCTRMVDRINHNVDRMSMAHSVEARPTFLDHTLWEFCAALPPDIKLRNRWLKPVEKYLLRQATRGLVPEDVRLRRKKGLFVPYAAWLKRPRLPEWAEAVVSRKAIEHAGLFDHDAVVRLRRDHQRGAPGRATLLMGIIAMQLWRKMLIESPPEQTWIPS